MLPHRILTRAFAAVCLLVPTASLAQEVVVEAPTNRLQDRLSAASLSVSLTRDENAQPRDFVAAARADYRRLLTVLYAEGFYSDQISIRVDGVEAASLDPLARRASVRRIVITVDPGPEFSFGRAEVAPLPPGTELPGTFATGEVARSTEIEAAARAGAEAWRAIGHAKADIASQEITARHGANVLDARVTLDPGRRLTFGPLTLTGAEAVRPERILQIAGYPEGSVYDPQAIALVQDRLRRIGTFRAASLIEADTALPDDRLPFELQVIEEVPRRVGFGAELSSIEGLSVSAFWLHRNLLGGAERLRFDAGITGIGGTTAGEDFILSTRFDRPATFGADTDLYASATAEMLVEPNYEFDYISTEIGIVRRQSTELTYEAGIGLLVGRTVDSLGTRDFELLFLPLSAELDRRDSPTDPSGGYYLRVEATPLYEVLSGGGGARVFADARGYLSFGEEDGVTLAARGLLGSVSGLDRADAPSDFLFYSGGGGTVRGQPYQSLGTTINGRTAGGLSFAGAQLEARVRVTNAIEAVGFYDVGLVGPDSLPDGNDPYHAGAGIGVRYQTGIGPLRLDLATPVTGDRAGERLELYLGIGQAF